MEKMLETSIIFSAMFSTIWKTNFAILATYELLYANALNLNQSIIWKRFNLLPDKILGLSKPKAFADILDMAQVIYAFL